MVKDNNPVIAADLKHRDNLGELDNLQLDILRYANRGGSRSNFIRDISFQMLDTARCDSIEFRLQEGDFNYFSEANIKPSRNFRLGVVNPITLPNGKTIPCTDSDTVLEKYYEASISRFLEAKDESHNDQERIVVSTSSGVTVRSYNEGAFNILDSSRGSSSARTFLVIPFSVDDDNVGIIIFKFPGELVFDESIIESYQILARAVGVAVAVRRTQYRLGERVKELSCLHAIASIDSQPNVPISDIINKIVLLLPPAMQYPDIAGGLIVLDGVSYITEGFQETPYKLTADITVNNVNRGSIEVLYGEAKSGFEPGLFLMEEQSLINAIAKQISLILESRQAEKEKADLQSQLRQADRLATIGQLAAGVAHELNEPLNSILGFAELIKMHPGLPSEIEGDTKKIIDASFYASDIVKKLLLFAREIVAGKKTVNINRTIEDGMYFIESRFVKENVDLLFNLSSNLPKIKVDPGQINQVIVNLAVNSIQAMPEGGTLIINTKADDENIYIIVEDTGTGIPEAIIDRIFLPFFTTKDVGEGTGLGLAVVHGIITSHGGTISVSSEVDVGSRFTVKLPINRGATGE